MNILDCIGNTPMVQLKDNLFVKLEYQNPFGSFKDRVALEMLKNVPEGHTIVETGTGNTAISLAFVANIKKIKSIFLIPKTVSQRKIQLLKLAGAEVVLFDSLYDCIKKRKKLYIQKKSYIHKTIW